MYGLDPTVVATALQRRVQASSVLQPIPGAKDKVLVQIQGNQIHQVSNLLLGIVLNNVGHILKKFSTVDLHCFYITEAMLSFIFQNVTKFLISTSKD